MDKTLPLFAGLALAIITIVGLSICLALVFKCGIPAEIMCENSVIVGATIAFAATISALGGASIIAWTLYRKQIHFAAKRHEEEDERHQEYNDRFNLLEFKIDQILESDDAEKSNGQ